MARFISQFYPHTYAFIHKQNEAHLFLLFQPKLVLICLTPEGWKAELGYRHHIGE